MSLNGGGEYFTNFRLLFNYVVCYFGILWSIFMETYILRCLYAYEGELESEKKMKNLYFEERGKVLHRKILLQFFISKSDFFVKILL